MQPILSIPVIGFSGELITILVCRIAYRLNMAPRVSDIRIKIKTAQLYDLAMVLNSGSDCKIKFNVHKILKFIEASMEPPASTSLVYKHGAPRGTILLLESSV